MTDTELLDFCADHAIVDGIGGIDIHDWVHERMTGDSEEEWKMLWRKGLRAALEAWIESESDK